jgi:DNA repair protein RecO (recombination protein O)
MIQGKSEESTGLVLGATPFKEDSAIVTFACESGLIPLLVPHVYKPKSPLKPLLLAGDYLKVTYRVRETGPNIVSSAEVLFDSSASFTDYATSCYLLFLQELTLALYRYGDRYPYEDISLLIRALIDGKDPLSVSLLTLGTFYSSLGIEENVTSCFACGRTDRIVGYSLEGGGFLCRGCLEPNRGHEASGLELHVLRYAFSPLSPLMLGKKVPAKEGEKILCALTENLLGYFDLRPIKSLPLFLSATEK